jgi:hypothetical protein
MEIYSLLIELIELSHAGARINCGTSYHQNDIAKWIADVANS